MPEPPVPTGAQDTLVVRVKFSDVPEPSLANLQNLMTEVVNYFNEVTYNQATILPDYRVSPLITPRLLLPPES